MSYRDHFFRVLVLVSKNFGLGVKVKTSVTSYSPNLLVGDEIISSKTGEKKLALNQNSRAAGVAGGNGILNKHC